MIPIPVIIGAAAMLVAIVGGQIFGWGKDNPVEEIAEEMAEKGLGLPSGSLDFSAKTPDKK